MNENAKTRVGVIGLGAMGMGVAKSLLRGGFEVHVCDLRADAVAQVVAAGGHAAATPMALGEKVDVAIVLVVNADQTEAVLFGEQGCHQGLAPGSVVIASATVSPEFAKSLGKRLDAAGLLMIDGPVSGGAAKAAAGEMTIMASGEPEAFAKCDAVLEGHRRQGLPARRRAGAGFGGQDGQPVAGRRPYRRRRRGHGAGNPRRRRSRTRSTR